MLAMRCKWLTRVPEIIPRSNRASRLFARLTFQAPMVCCENRSLASPPGNGASILMTTHTIGTAVLDRFHRLGVRHMFGIPGDYVLGLYKLMESSPIQHVATTRKIAPALLPTPMRGSTASGPSA